MMEVPMRGPPMGQFHRRDLGRFPDRAFGGRQREMIGSFAYDQESVDSFDPRMYPRGRGLGSLPPLARNPSPLRSFDRRDLSPGRQFGMRDALELRPSRPHGMSDHRNGGPRQAYDMRDPLDDISPFGRRGYDISDIRRRDFSPGRAWEMSREPAGPQNMYDHHIAPNRIKYRQSGNFEGENYRREISPRSVDGLIKQENNQLGWQDQKNRPKGYDDMYLPTIRVNREPPKPRHKFGSPEHVAEIRYKYDDYDKNRNMYNRYDRYEREYGRENDTGYDRDRNRERSRDQGYKREQSDRNRRGRRDDWEYSWSSDEDDSNDYDDNPYHHLPAHLPKDGYDNAIKRNLHAWTEWRTGFNDRVIRGQGEQNRERRMDSLRGRIERQNVRDPDQYGVKLNDPAVLMNYSQSYNQGTPLNQAGYLNYGIPRVKDGGDFRELYKQRGRHGGNY